jgi:hypothetical protein
VVAAVVTNTTNSLIDFDYRNGPKGGLALAGGSSSKTTTLKLTTATLEDILIQFQAPTVIDYISLDVEGAEDMVLEHFPFDRYRIKVWTIEKPSKQLALLLESHDYVFLKKLRRSVGETLWIHREEQQQLNVEEALAIETQEWKYKEK